MSRTSEDTSERGSVPTGGPKLLCVGDVHLGRRPSGLPPGADAAAYGPAAALADAVATALAERVDAVLFAGDVVDLERDFFEAYQPLAEAARRLVAAGIEVVCVAGNHDVEVLPRLAREVAGVRLLGAGGRWELHTVQRAGAPLCRVLGWSFPAAVVTHSPLRDLDARWLTGELESQAERLPVVGLLHADLDQSASRYAPVARNSLQGVRGVDAWLLGHVHLPSDLAADPRPIGYLGSLSTLDPGALGARGPWLAAWASRHWSLRPLANARLRFERVEVDAADARDDAELEARLVQALRDLGERLVREGARARLVGARLRLVGRTPLARAARTVVLERARAGLRLDAGELQLYVESVRDEALPALALERMARANDPPGLLARRILALEAGGAEARRLVQRALPALHARAEHASFTVVLEAPALDEASVRALLLEAGRRALDELLAQRPPEAAAELAIDDDAPAPARADVEAEVGR